MNTVRSAPSSSYEYAYEPLRNQVYLREQLAGVAINVRVARKAGNRRSPQVALFNTLLES